MNPEQVPPPTAPTPGNGEYDFIVNPNKPEAPKQSPIPGARSPFAIKILLIIGAPLVIMVFLFILVSLIFSGSSTNTANLISLSQIQQELIRIGGEGDKAATQATKNLAITTELSLTTQQKQLLRFLAQKGTTVGEKQLQEKADPKTDKLLESAKQTSTYDIAYLQVMENLLTTYSTAIDNAYDDATSKEERALLKTQYDQAQLLITQIPEDN